MLANAAVCDQNGKVVSSDEHRYEIVEQVRQFGRADGEVFDRLDFAVRALEVLQPAGMTVAVYERRRDLLVEHGRARNDRTWAMVGIPPHASRQHIAYALAELAGVDAVPYVVDVLVAADKHQV